MEQNSLVEELRSLHERIFSNLKWRKYYLKAFDTAAVQKIILLIGTEKDSEVIRQATDDLKRIFLSTYEVVDEQDNKILIKIFGLAEIPTVYLLEGIITIGATISKGIPYRHSALFKLNRRLPYPALFNAYGDASEALRVISSVLARRQRRADTLTDPETMDAIFAKLPLVDDATQACLLLAGDAIVNGCMLGKVHLQQFDKTLAELLKKPDVLLSKLMATIILTKNVTKSAKGDTLLWYVKLLADYVKLCEGYETIVQTVFIHEQMDLRQEVAKRMAYLAREFPEFESVFTELALDNLKELTSSNMTHYAMEALLLYVLKAPLIPGTKIGHLPIQAREFFTALTKIDHIWKNQQVCDMLATYSLPNTPEKMSNFIEDTADDSEILFPAFKTLDLVPWNTFEHAYGTASRVPTLIRELASWVPSVRGNALNSLENSVTHQGQCYPVTPYIVPFLLELVEAKLVQDKAKLLEYCTALLTDRAGYFLATDGLDLEYVWLAYPEILEIRLDIEKRFMEEIPKILGFLAHEQTEASSEPSEVTYIIQYFGITLEMSVRGWAAYLLLLLPKAANRIAPKLRERYELETDSQVRATILTALGSLWPKCDAGLDPFMKFATEQYETFKNSDHLDLEFAAISCLTRWSEDDLAVRRLIKLMLEDDKPSEKRANFAIRVPKEFILESLQFYVEAVDLLPLAEQHMLSSNYATSMAACSTTFSLAFRSFVFFSRPIMHGGVFTREQRRVVETAAEFYRVTCLHFYDMQEKGLPHCLQSCQELLEEATVFDDLYGLSM